MAFNFPSNPAEGETIQAGRFSFQYSGGKWNSVLANPKFSLVGRGLYVPVPQSHDDNGNVRVDV